MTDPRILELILQSPLWPTFTQSPYRFSFTLGAVFMAMSLIAPLLCAVIAWRSRPRGQFKNPKVSLGFIIAAALFAALACFMWVGQGWWTNNSLIFAPYMILGPALIAAGLIWGGKPDFKPSRLALILTGAIITYLTTLPFLVITLFPPKII